MLVCHCRGITDRQIRNLVREGATSPREVARATGAGMRCGGCRTNVKQVVNETLASGVRVDTVGINACHKKPVGAPPGWPPDPSGHLLTCSLAT